mmetsp:Transcript_34554/g.72363  ORF Transcript_34554/g.72363 Transcript_34554/m.72363 type:complete len:379 (-) Transcript_34554:169-1305(-)
MPLSTRACHRNRFLLGSVIVGRALRFVFVGMLFRDADVGEGFGLIGDDTGASPPSSGTPLLSWFCFWCCRAFVAWIRASRLPLPLLLSPPSPASSSSSPPRSWNTSLAIAFWRILEWRAISSRPAKARTVPALPPLLLLLLVSVVFSCGCCWLLFAPSTAKADTRALASPLAPPLPLVFVAPARSVPDATGVTTGDDAEPALPLLPPCCCCSSWARRWSRSRDSSSSCCCCFWVWAASFWFFRISRTSLARSDPVTLVSVAEGMWDCSGVELDDDRPLLLWEACELLSPFVAADEAAACGGCPFVAAVDVAASPLSVPAVLPLLSLVLLLLLLLLAWRTTSSMAAALKNPKVSRLILLSVPSSWGIRSQNSHIVSAMP